MNALYLGIIMVLGAVVIYLIAFWGSAIFKGLYSYTNDGEKTCKDLCDVLEGKIWGLSVDFATYFAFGWLFPFLFGLGGCFLVVLIVKVIGLSFSIYIISIITVSYLALYTLRGVVRLNKRLDKHTSDKDAHK